MNRTVLLSGAATAALVLGAGGATAQTPTPFDIQLQQQIQQLQQQLQSLQSQLNAQTQQQQQQQHAAAPPAAPGPHVVETSGNRFGLESADGQYSMYLTGRLNLDIGGYPSYHQDSHATSPSDLNAGINARRARLGVTGKFAGDWNYTFIYDFGGSSDGFDIQNPSGSGSTAGGGGVGVSGGALSGVENAFVTYNGLNSGPFPLAFDAGYQDVPFTLDEATSANDIMFMERSSSQVIATEFGFGDSRSALGVRSNGARSWGGVYVTGPVSGSAHNTGEPLSSFGRFTYNPIVGPNYSWHVGVDLGGMIKPENVLTAATATPTGSVVGGTPAGNFQAFTLSDRPELRIDPTSLLSATFGSIAHPVSGGSVLGLETAAGYDNLFVQGEGFNYRVDRDGLPANTFWGGYLESSVTLTGEHRTYIPATGAYSGIVPAHPFSLSAGTWGAFELAARLSYVNLDDNYVPGVSAASNGIEGGRQTAYGLGINWYLNPNMRLMLDYLHVVFKKSSGATTDGEVGADIDEIGARAQVAF